MLERCWRKSWKLKSVLHECVYNERTQPVSELQRGPHGSVCCLRCMCTCVFASSVNYLHNWQYLSIVDDGNGKYVSLRLVLQWKFDSAPSSGEVWGCSVENMCAAGLEKMSTLRLEDTQWNGRLLVPDTALCPLSLKTHVPCLSAVLSPTLSPALSVCCPNITRLATFFFLFGLLNFPSLGHFLTGSRAFWRLCFCLAHSLDSVRKL